MKIDYYLGITLDAKGLMLLDWLYKWYKNIERNVDAKVISITNSNNLYSKIYRKFLLLSGLPVSWQRRKNSLLHIASVNLVNQSISFMARSPLIVTCFDAIIYEKNAEELALKKDRRTIQAHYKIMQKADRIITLSNHAKERISKVCEVNRDKIDVVHLAVDHNEFYPMLLDRKHEMMRKFCFEPANKNILYVGSESPRKNLERIFYALTIVRKHFDIRFVKVGAPTEPYHSQLKSLVRELKLDDVVTFYLPENRKQIPMLYNLSDIFIFPSIYEGFGLPPLEAMACGCPVVTSGETSLPEVVGDAAEKVNPYDYKDIAMGILKVLDDDIYRRELIERGIKRALNFTWERSAKSTLSVYSKVHDFHSIS